MSDRLGSLHTGDRFQTLATGRSGRVLGHYRTPDGNTVHVLLMHTADHRLGVEEKSLHPDVQVRRLVQ